MVIYIILLTDRLSLYDAVVVRQSMTRWSKDTNVFKVKLSKNKNKDGSHSKICRIPKPIVKFLGEPTCIKFVIQEKKVMIEASKI